MENFLSAVKENIHNLVIQRHHLIRKHQIYFINRSSSKEILSLKNKKQLHRDCVIKRSSMITILARKISTH